MGDLIPLREFALIICVLSPIMKKYYILQKLLVIQMGTVIFIMAIRIMFTADWVTDFEVFGQASKSTQPSQGSFR